MSAAIVLPPQLGSWVQVGTTNAAPHAAPPAQYFAPAQPTGMNQGYQNAPMSPAQQAPNNYQVQTRQAPVYTQPVQQQQQQQPTQAIQPYKPVPSVPQHQGGADFTEEQITAKYPRFVVIDLKNAAVCPQALQACGLTQDHYQAITQRVSMMKRSHNKSKATFILLFGLMGYLHFRSKNPYLRESLKPVLVKYNQMLGQQGIAVRFLWADSQLRAFHM